MREQAASQHKASYQESKGLSNVSKDSVMRFKDKLDQYVSANPDAKNHVLDNGRSNRRNKSYKSCKCFGIIKNKIYLCRIVTK